MDPAEIERDLATSVLDLSAKVREAVLAGNAGGAVEWAGALRDATAAWREVAEQAEAI